MKPWLNRRICCVAGVLLLAGCQQSARKMPPQTTQIQQLSAMVAASDWLRDNCDRQDIPSQSTLLGSAMAQATERGWRFTETGLKQIQAEAEHRYQAISVDTGSKAGKCAVLNRAATPFLQRVAIN